MACGGCAKRKANLTAERRASATTGRGTRIFFYVQPPPEHKKPEVRFLTLREARDFMRAKNAEENGWVLHQRRESTKALVGDEDES